MRILIIGGTRFAGRLLASQLLANGNEVAVLSRRPEKAPVGVKVYGGERDRLIEEVARQQDFDLIVDFVTGEEGVLKRTLDMFASADYIFISTVWVTKVEGDVQADQIVERSAIIPANLPEVTRSYLHSKIQAESEILEAYGEGRNALIIRLPILFGENDSTGRLDFYRMRVADGHGCILVNGGNNRVQINFISDIVEAMLKLIDEKLYRVAPVLEGLSSIKGVTVYDLIRAISTLENVPVNVYPVSASHLLEEFPSYLQYEPFWRETTISMTRNNLFSLTDVKPLSLRSGLQNIFKNCGLKISIDDRRKMEMEFLSRQRS